MEGLPVPAALLAALLTLLQGLPPARAGNAYRVGWGGHTPRPRVSLLSTTPPPASVPRGGGGHRRVEPRDPRCWDRGGGRGCPRGIPAAVTRGGPRGPRRRLQHHGQGRGGGGTASRGGARGTPWDSGGPPWLQPWGGTVGDRDSPPPTPGRGVFPVGPLGVLPPGQGCSSWGEGAPPGPLVGVLPVGQGFFPPPPQGEGAPCGSPGRGAPHGAVGGGALPAAGVLPPGPSVGVLPVARGCTPRGRGAIPRVTWWGCCPWNGGAGGVGSPGCLDPLAGLGGQQTGGGLGKHLKRK